MSSGPPETDGWGATGLDLVDPALPPVLARAQIDRVSARRGDPGWLDEAWASRGRVLALGTRGQVAAEGSALVLSEAQGPRPEDSWFLGADEAGAYFVVPGGELAGRDLRELGASLSAHDAALFSTAVALANWHAVTRHCPRCGARLEVEAAGWLLRCPLDRSQHFPRSDPAVIMLVTSPDGSRCVLGRGASWPPRRFSCLAGFVEPGESAEQAVVREVGEESGLAVREVRPVGSQPWPFPASLMLGFRAVGDPTDVPVSADGELQEVAWFSREDILGGAVVLPPPVSIANRIIAEWLAEGGRGA